MKKERIKKVNRKVGGGLIFLLTTLALFSVGFSSWTFVENPRFQQELKVQADQIVDLNDFFNFQEPQMFEISPNGIIIDDQLSYIGTVRISFYIKIKEGIFSFLTNNYLQLELLLENTGGFNLLQSTFTGSTPIVYYQISETFISNPELVESIQGTLENNQIEIILAYENENLENINFLFFNIEYRFDFSAYSENFESEIYNQAENQKVNLNFRVEVKSL